MKTSETLRKLADSLADTIGNRIVKRLLSELVDEVVNLERERDDAIEEAQAASEREEQLRNRFDGGCI